MTSGARRQRYEQADWHAVQQAMKTVSIFTIITLVWSWSNCAALRHQDRSGHFYQRKESITRGCCRITRASRLRRAFLTPCTVGYLTTARLLPSGFLSLAPSQTRRFRLFRSRRTFTRSRLGISADARYQRPALRLSLAE
ncbi:hypothetical protein ACLB1N_22645 [Escherichia coli]